MGIRNAVLALATLTMASGCHVGGAGNLLKPEAPAPRAALQALPAIEAHNRNAELFQALKARPKIDIAADGQSFPVSGMLLMERPRNFKLEMRGGPLSREVADIGSNDDEFWFWISNKKDNAIRFCRHEEIGSSPLASTFEPDWVVEALGLRVIPKSETSTLASAPGPRPGTYLLTQRRKSARNEALIKETLIDDSGKILEHRLYSGDKRMVARASVTKFQAVPLAGTDDEGRTRRAWLPSQVKLEWFQERLTLDIALNSPVINPSFTLADREAMFTEPRITGAARIDLAREGLRNGMPTEPRSSRNGTMRSTRPAPPSGGGIQLGDPEPLNVEEARRAPRDPIALTADLRNTPAAPATRESVVGAPIPRGADSDLSPLPPLPRSTWHPSRLEQ